MKKIFLLGTICFLFALAAYAQAEMLLDRVVRVASTTGSAISGKNYRNVVSLNAPFGIWYYEFTSNGVPVNVVLLPNNQVNNFIYQKRYSCYPEFSSFNAKSGTIKVQYRGGPISIGIENTHSLNATDVTIKAYKLE